MKKLGISKKDKSNIFLSFLQLIFGFLLLIITIRSFFGDFLLPFDMSKSLINYVFSFSASFILICLPLFDIFLVLKKKKSDK